MSFQDLALARVAGVLCLKKLVDIGFTGAFAVRDAGGCPAATYFLCFAKESRQRKATRGSSPPQKRGGTLRCSRVKAAAELGLEGAAVVEVKAPLALKQSSPTSPSLAPPLGNRCIGFPLDRRACPQGHARNPCLPCDSHRGPVVLRRPRLYSVIPA